MYEIFLQEERRRSRCSQKGFDGNSQRESRTLISVPIYQWYFFSSATLAFHLSLFLMQWTWDMLDFEDKQTFLVGFVMYFMKWLSLLKPGRFFSLWNVFFFLYDDHPSSVRLEIRIHSQPFVRLNKSYIALSFLWKSKAYPIEIGRKIAYLFPAQGTKKCQSIAYIGFCGRKWTAIASLVLRSARWWCFTSRNNLRSCKLYNKTKCE